MSLTSVVNKSNTISFTKRSLKIDPINAGKFSWPVGDRFQLTGFQFIRYYHDLSLSRQNFRSSISQYINN